MPIILPYRVEYSMTEERCIKCRKSIPRDDIQIGIMQQVSNLHTIILHFFLQNKVFLTRNIKLGGERGE